MKENVGKLDRIVRSVMGPSLVVLGYSRLGGSKGHPVGLLSMIAGAGVIESAITRVCPLSRALGIDTRSEAQAFDDTAEALDEAVQEITEMLP